MDSPSPRNVPTALPKFPTSMAGTMSSVQFFPAASAPAVAGPPTLALLATKTSSLVSPRPFHLLTASMAQMCTKYSTARNANNAGYANTDVIAPPAAPADAKKMNRRRLPNKSPAGRSRSFQPLGQSVANATAMRVSVGRIPSSGGATLPAMATTAHAVASTTDGSDEFGAEPAGSAHAVANTADDSDEFDAEPVSSAHAVASTADNSDEFGDVAEAAAGSAAGEPAAASDAAASDADYADGTAGVASATDAVQIAGTAGAAIPAGGACEASLEEAGDATSDAGSDVASESGGSSWQPAWANEAPTAGPAATLGTMMGSGSSDEDDDDDDDDDENDF